MTLPVCYENNGLPSGDVPCDPYAATSACCGVGCICVSNLNCVDNSGASVPGTRTDQGWGSLPNPACSLSCTYVSPSRAVTYNLLLRTTPMALLLIPG